VKLKLDENLGVRTAEVFRAAGHEVATVDEQGLRSSPDSEISVVCAGERRVLVTLDKDFADPLLVPPERSAGVAVLRVPDLPGSQALVAAAMRLVAAMEAGEITGQLWIVGTTRVRKYWPEVDI
jgi:predicted nuclease of predicted toxin-antitoxin system